MVSNTIETKKIYFIDFSFYVKCRFVIDCLVHSSESEDFSVYLPINVRTNTSLTDAKNEIVFRMRHTGINQAPSVMCLFPVGRPLLFLNALEYFFIEINSIHAPYISSGVRVWRKWVQLGKLKKKTTLNSGYRVNILIIPNNNVSLPHFQYFRGLSHLLRLDLSNSITMMSTTDLPF